VPNGNFVRALVHALPSTRFGSRNLIGEVFAFVNWFAEPRVSYDHFAKKDFKGLEKDKTTAPRAGEQVCHFRRRVAPSDGASHRPVISPRPAPCRVVASGVAPASLCPATGAFWIDNSSRNSKQEFGVGSAR
jgi:hypothetical protein